MNQNGSFSDRHEKNHLQNLSAAVHIPSSSSLNELEQGCNEHATTISVSWFEKAGTNIYHELQKQPWNG